MAMSRVPAWSLVLAVALLAADGSSVASLSDVDPHGWCNILLLRGGGSGARWGTPAFLESASKTTALWKTSLHSVQWDSSLRLFIYKYLTTTLYYGVVQPGGDVVWRTGAIPGASAVASGDLPAPTSACASRFREEDHAFCEYVLVHKAGVNDVNVLFLRRSPSPSHGVYQSVADQWNGGGGRMLLNLTQSRVEITMVSPHRIYYYSNAFRFPVSDITDLQLGAFGRKPTPLLSCVELVPIPTPPPMGGAGSRPLVHGRGAAGVARPEEFTYFSYTLPRVTPERFEIRVAALGGGGGPDGFWFLALDDTAVPTLEGFRWSGDKCVSVQRGELNDPRATVFVGVYKFGGPATPFTIRVVENPADSHC